STGSACGQRSLTAPLLTLVQSGTPPWAWAETGQRSRKLLIVVTTALNRSADSFVREFRNFGSGGHGCPRSGFLDCGGKRSATPLWLCVRKRRRRCALPAHSKTSRKFARFDERCPEGISRE